MERSLAGGGNAMVIWCALGSCTGPLRQLDGVACSGQAVRSMPRAQLRSGQLLAEMTLLSVQRAQCSRLSARAPHCSPAVPTGCPAAAPECVLPRRLVPPPPAQAALGTRQPGRVAVVGGMEDTGCVTQDHRVPSPEQLLAGRVGPRGSFSFLLLTAAGALASANGATELVHAWPVR